MIDNQDDKTNFDYMINLTDEQLIKTIKWHLNPVVEEEFGGLELKTFATLLCEHWEVHKTLSDAQRISLRACLMKLRI